MRSKECQGCVGDSGVSYLGLFTGMIRRYSLDKCPHVTVFAEKKTRIALMGFILGPSIYRKPRFKSLWICIHRKPCTCFPFSTLAG